MKYIFLWDINGKPWRKVIKELLPKYIKKYQPDFIFANSENLSHWKWANSKQLDEMQEFWINFFTWWNHSFDTKQCIEEFENLQNNKKDKKNKLKKRQLRPLNYPEWTIWDWYFLIDEKVLLVSVMWNTFMQTQLENPILCIENLFEKIKSEIWEKEFSNLDIFIDIHAETSSEKKAIWYNFDWIATCIVWTHTHIQTNDAQIFKNWTWYITDLWMNWSFESIIWIKKEIIINRIKTQIWEKFELEEDWKLEFSWIFCETENLNWKSKCKKIELIKEIIEQ